MASTKKTVLVVGGTGAQGAAVIKTLIATGRYKVLALTRNTSSPRAKDLAALADVELVHSPRTHGYDPAAFLEAAKRADAVFINTDGFALGEIAETFWGIRLFELSVRAGVKHLVYSGLDYNGKKTNHADDLYVGHYEGKARVQEWMHAQGKDGSITWTIVKSGPYVDMLSEGLRPQISEDGTATFSLPLGEEGQMPFVSLADFGRYVDWALSNPDQSRGLDFGIAIEHAGLKELAAAFTAVTGKPATYNDIPIDAWHKVAWARLPHGPETKIGYISVRDNNVLNQTYRENFTNWYNLYKASAGNKGLIQRDYAFLDKILPDRHRSIEDWMRRTGYTGEAKSVLKKSMENY